MSLFTAKSTGRDIVGERSRLCFARNANKLGKRRSWREVKYYNLCLTEPANFNPNKEAEEIKTIVESSMSTMLEKCFKVVHELPKRLLEKA